MNGLVIKSSCIDRILSGQKTWELRGLPTRVRGPVALIPSGTGRIVGTCHIVDCLGPLTLEHIQANVDKLALPLETLSQLPFPKTYAWTLANPKTLAQPIEIPKSRGGAWIRLTPENVGSRFAELTQTPDTNPVEQPNVEVTVCANPPVLQPKAQ